MNDTQYDLSLRNITVVRAKMRQKARNDLLFLLTEVLQYRDVEPEVHGDLLSSLQTFNARMEDDQPTVAGRFHYKPSLDIWNLQGPRKRLLLYPRGHLKTTIITIGHMIQWIINYPDIRILLSMATGDQVVKVARELKAHFQYNEKFRWLFPEYCPSAKQATEFGTQDGFEVPNRQRKWLKEPTISSCSVGKVVAGGHYEIICNSDLVDKENVKTPNQIQEVISHFGYLNPLLERGPVPPHHGWTYVEGTRYDFSDLYGTIIEGEEKRKSIEKEWVILKRGAIKPDGTSLWKRRFPISELDNIRKDPTVGEVLFSCFPAYSNVLMSNWQEKPIQNLVVGDEIIGFSKGLVRAKVQYVHVTRSKVIKAITESGRVVYCTPDHKFLRPLNGSRKYGKISVGTQLVSVYKPSNIPTSIEQRLLDWLGGLLDGEGSVSSKIDICQSPEANPEVHLGIQNILNFLNIPFHAQKNRGGYKNTPTTIFTLHGGRSLKIRLLRDSQMRKRERFVDSLWASSGTISETSGRRGGNSYEKIVSIEDVGERVVYNIQSSSGNFVCQGYAVANCQYLNDPIPPEGGLCRPDAIKWISRALVRELLPHLRLHVTIDLHGMEANSSTNDYTVLTLAGFDRDGRVYVVDIRRGRFTPHQVIYYLFKLHVEYPRIIDFKIEKDAHARVLLPFLYREMSKRNRYPVIVPLKRDNRNSKQNRIRGLQPWFEAGIIRFVDDLDCRLDILNEIVRFPKYIHDDILDTLADQMLNRDSTLNYDVSPEPVNPEMGRTVPGWMRDRFIGFGTQGEEEWVYGPNHERQQEREAQYQENQNYHKTTGL